MSFFINNSLLVRMRVNVVDGLLIFNFIIEVTFENSNIKYLNCDCKSEL